MKLLGYLLLLIYSGNLLAMDRILIPEEYITGAELMKVVRLVLASCCVQGNCKCRPSKGKCKYLDAYNDYLEQKRSAQQLHNWREAQRKSM